ETTRFTLGGGYHKENTVFPGDMADERFSTHARISHTAEDGRFKTDASISYSVNVSNLIRNDLTPDALSLAPNAPGLYLDDGSLNWDLQESGVQRWINPLRYLNEGYDAKANTFIGNLQLSYELLPRLELKTSISYTNTLRKDIITF